MPALSPEDLKAILSALDGRSVDRQLLQEFREDQLVINNTFSNRIDHFGEDIKHLTSAIEKQSYDIAKVVSNHQTEWKLVRNDISDSDMEHRDCKTELRAEMYKNFPTTRQLKNYATVGMIVGGVVMSVMLWVSSNLVVKGTDTSNNKLKGELIELFEEYRKADKK